MFQKFLIRQLEKFWNMKLTKLKKTEHRNNNIARIWKWSDIFKFIPCFWVSQILHYQKWAMLWTWCVFYQVRHLLLLWKYICWMVGRASGPTKITGPEFESLFTTLISCYYLRPLLSSLGLCSPNARLILHSCLPLITQLRSPEEVVQDAFVDTPSHTDHLPSPLLL